MATKLLPDILSAILTVVAAVVVGLAAVVIIACGVYGGECAAIMYGPPRVTYGYMYPMPAPPQTPSPDTAPFKLPDKSAPF